MQSKNLTLLISNGTCGAEASLRTYWLRHISFEIFPDSRDGLLLDVVARFRDLEYRLEQTDSLDFYFRLEVVAFDAAALEAVAEGKCATWALAALLG